MFDMLLSRFYTDYSPKKNKKTHAFDLADIHCPMLRSNFPPAVE